jgi:peroxiredoxin
MPKDQLSLGMPAPPFLNLPGTDGTKYSLATFAGKKILVIVFSCNHCPYVQAYEGRMIAFQRDYSQQGVLLLAINSNETVHYPEDNFDAMVKRAASEKFNFPYLRDDNQSVATAYGATHTPQFFVFDEKRHLRYRGKMDDNHQNPSAVKSMYLRNAVDQLLAGKETAEPETYSIGCTIKWMT